MADYHSLLMRAVANLPNAGTPATRGAIYGRARKALLEQLRSLRPPLPESDIAREEKALDAAIAEIEGRYGSQDAAEPPASSGPAPTPPSPAAGKRARRACAEGRFVAPAPSRRRCPRPAAPARAWAAAASARSPSQTGARGQPEVAPGAPVQPAAAQRPQPPGLAGRPAAHAAAGGRGFAGSIPAGRGDRQPSAIRAGRAAPSVGAKGGKDEGLPGVAALDPARAVRPSKADDGRASGAPAVVATPPRRTRAIGRGAGSGGGVRPPRIGPDRMQKSSARLRRASTSPSQNPCSGSRRRSSLALSLRWREPRS